MEDLLFLFEEYDRVRDRKLRDKIIIANSGLVYSIALQLVNTCKEPLDDLVQVGYIGLIKSVDNFDYKKGNKFSTYATVKIRGEIQQHIRDKGSLLRVRRKFWEMKPKINKVISKRGILPDSEMAIELGLSLTEWLSCKQSLANHYPVSLDMEAV